MESNNETNSSIYTHEISISKRRRPLSLGLCKNGFPLRKPRGPSSNESTKRTRKRTLFEKAQQLAIENKGHIIIFLAFENKREFSVDLQAFGTVAQEFYNKESFQNCKKEWEAIITKLNINRNKESSEQHLIEDHPETARKKQFEESEGQNDQIQHTEENSDWSPTSPPRFQVTAPRKAANRTSREDAVNSMSGFGNKRSSSRKNLTGAAFPDGSLKYEEELLEVNSVAESLPAALVSSSRFSEQISKNQQLEKNQDWNLASTPGGQPTVLVNPSKRICGQIAGHDAAKKCRPQIISLTKQEVEELKNTGKLAHLEIIKSNSRPSAVL